MRKNKPEKLNRLSREAQNMIAKVELDAVVAIEREEAKDAQLRVAMKELKLTKGKLDTIMKDAHQCTDWVDMLGKKGERYSLVMVEIGLQMMSSMLSAPQAVFCLTMFMQTTYPGLQTGVDYRLPSESTFKKWGELLYPVVRDLNRSVVDDAFVIYLHHDGVGCCTNRPSVLVAILLTLCYACLLQSESSQSFEVHWIHNKVWVQKSRDGMR